MMLYCAAVKLHKTAPDLTWDAVQGKHINRPDFPLLYKTIVGHDLPTALRAHLAPAEKTRDSIMHGKDAPDSAKRAAVVSVLNYAEAFNTEAHQHCGIRPFGKLRGFKGRSKSLSPSTSRWILKGMGFSV